MSRHFVIIGLGRLGSAMLETLLSLGHEELGIDSDENLVQNLSGEFPHAHLIAADATNQWVLHDLSVGHFDAPAAGTPSAIFLAMRLLHACTATVLQPG